MITHGPYVWSNDTIEAGFNEFASCVLTENARQLGPTINYHADQKLRRKGTPEQLERVSIRVEPTDLIYNDVDMDYVFETSTPNVIESDYRGELHYIKIAPTQIHMIASNPLKSITDLSMARGENMHHFTKSFSNSIHRSILGMIYQWKISTLEVISQVLTLQENWNNGGLQMQKEWVHKVAAKHMWGIQEYDMRHVVPLRIIKKDFIPLYLDEKVISGGDEIVFFFNMVNCKTVEVITCSVNYKDMVIGTRFDGDNDLFYAFGY